MAVNKTGWHESRVEIFVGALWRVADTINIQINQP